jgi:hypothetical protein
VNFKQWFAEWEGNTSATGQSPQDDPQGKNPQAWPVRSRLGGPGTVEPRDMKRKPEIMYGVKPQLVLKTMKKTNK